MRPYARRTGIAQTAGLIVEGDTEFAALPRLATKRLVANCPPIQATNLGGVGSDVPPVGIAKRVVQKVRQHRAANRCPVIICIDRESRAESAFAFAAAILERLREELGDSADDVCVCIADRTFEAWLLADARGLHKRGALKRAPKFFCFEGELGKRGKKGVIELGELLGREYSKTIDGPALFEQLNFAVARRCRAQEHGSRSLHNFLQALGT